MSALGRFVEVLEGSTLFSKYDKVFGRSESSEIPAESDEQLAFIDESMANRVVRETEVVAGSGLRVVEQALRDERGALHRVMIEEGDTRVL